MFENEKFLEILTALRQGDVILYPTDTIWGIGCDATNETAVHRISEIKSRQPERGYILLVDSLTMLKKYVGEIHPRVETLLAYHSRPLTIIYDESSGLASNVLAPDGSVGIRITQDPFCRELIKQLGKPIVSTSANQSGQPFPSHYGEVSSDILEKVDLVVKYKQDNKEHGEPSVIARFNPDQEELDFLRE